jgi:hypothetical protein
MKAAGFALFSLTAIVYVWTVRTIWQLVDQANRLESGRRFNRFWWTPAWKVHKAAFPASPLRRKIVARFLITWGLGALALACFVYAEIHAAGWPVR